MDIETGCVRRFDSPAAPITPAGRWFVLPATGEADDLWGSTSAFGKIFLGGVGTLSPAFAIFFPFGPAYGPEFLLCGDFPESTLPSSDNWSTDLLGFELTYPVFCDIFVLSSVSGVSESAGDVEGLFEEAPELFVDVSFCISDGIVSGVSVIFCFASAKRMF